jgi:hypothetical protein
MTTNEYIRGEKTLDGNRSMANYGNAIIGNTSSEMNNPIKPFRNTLLIIRQNG